MKFIVIAHRSDKHSPEQFVPLLVPEAKAALKLMAEDFVREIYSRADGKGAVLIIEARDTDEVRERLSVLPLLKAGMLALEIYPVQPYRGIVQAAQG